MKKEFIGLDSKITVKNYFPSQFRPEQLSATMLELASKRHDKAHMKREHDLARRRLEPFHVRSDPGMYSTFGDKQLYGGLVPTG